MAANNLPEMPCGPVLELNGQRKRFHVPYGLKPLIEIMTREVLRYQPENIYEFLAVFMEARMQTKEEEKAQQEKRKSWQEHRWSWEGTSLLESKELEEFLNEIDITKEQAEQHALVIQSAFRGFQARKKVKELRKSLELQGDSLNASAGKSEGEDEEEEGEHKKRKSWEQHRWSSEGKSVLQEADLEEFLDEIQVTKEEAEQHATVIQAAYRGFQARKKVKELRKSLELQPKSEADGETIEPPEGDEVEPSSSGIEKTKSPEAEEDEQPESRRESQEAAANEDVESTEQVQEDEQPTEVTPDEEGEQPSPTPSATQAPEEEEEEQQTGATENEE